MRISMFVLIPLVRLDDRKDDDNVVYNNENKDLNDNVDEDDNYDDDYDNEDYGDDNIDNDDDDDLDNNNDDDDDYNDNVDYVDGDDDGDDDDVIDIDISIFLLIIIIIFAIIGIQYEVAPPVVDTLEFHASFPSKMFLLTIPPNVCCKLF
jgi:hypothetical protein